MDSASSPRRLLGAVGLAALAYLVFFHLGTFPRLFFDEGTYLKLAQNLAFHGLYAESNADGPLYYGAPLGIGPTIHVPVAAAFLLLGPGVVQGRLVITLYLLATLLCFHRLARHLGGARMAWAATMLLLVTPSLSLVATGRQVMGELPGFFFVVAALLVWLRDWGRPSTGRLLAAASLFALGALSKNQFALILDLSLAICFALNAVYYRLVPARVFLVPLVVTVASHASWSLALLYLILPEGRAEILASGPHVAGFATMILPPLQQAAAGLHELVRPGAYFFLLVPALAYGVYRGRERNLEEQKWSIVLVIPLVNFAWFVLVSVGWTRYIFLGLGLAALLVARLLARLTGDFRLAPAGAGGRGWAVLRGALLLWVALGVGVSAARLWRDIGVTRPDHAGAMAAFLDEQVPKDAVIETWEPEMAFLSDRRFHFPPSALMGEAIAYIHFGGPPPYTFYDPLAERPPRYLLAGEFSIYVKGYDFEEVHRRYRRLRTFGPYELFEIDPAS